MKILFSALLMFILTLTCYGGYVDSFGRLANPQNTILAELINTEMSLSTINARDANGLYIFDDAGNLGIFIEDGGQVGIGTNNPTVQLHVDGIFKVTNANQNSVISAEDASGNINVLFNASNNSYIKNNFLVGQVSGHLGIALEVSGNLNQTNPIDIHEFWGFLNANWTVDESTGSTTFLSKANGWVRLTTGAINGDARSYDDNDICMYINTKRPSFLVRLQLEQTNNMQCAFGLKEAGSGWGNDYVRVIKNNAGSNIWTLEVSNGGSTTTDTGQAATTAEIKFSVIFTSDTTLEWFIDGASQGTVSTNVPTNLQQKMMQDKTEENAAHFTEFDYFKVLPSR